MQSSPRLFAETVFSEDEPVYKGEAAKLEFSPIYPLFTETRAKKIRYIKSSSYGFLFSSLVDRYLFTDRTPRRDSNRRELRLEQSGSDYPNERAAIQYQGVRCGRYRMVIGPA